jgi:hypothetical protein
MERKYPLARDKSPMKPRGDVSLSAFGFLFSEMVQYYQNRVSSTSDLEKKLEEGGFGIGVRVVELVGVRERLTKRETRVVGMLQYITQSIWRHIFGKTADNLEKHPEDDDSYMIYERTCVTNHFVSVPSDMGNFNCAAFIAGIISGIYTILIYYIDTTSLAEYI